MEGSFRRYLSYGFLVIACSLFGYTFFFSGASDHVSTLRQQLKMQERERAEVQHRVDDLTGTLVGIESDPDVLERLAREELKLMGEDEELLIFESQ